MNPKRQLALIIFSTVLAGFSLASIINFTSPHQATPGTLIFFYLSLFLTTLGILTLLGFLVRAKLNPGHFISNFAVSFRQGILISLLIVGSFLLMSLRLLFWWVELSLILFLLTIEVLLNLKI